MARIPAAGRLVLAEPMVVGMKVTAAGKMADSRIADNRTGIGASSRVVMGVIMAAVMGVVMEPAVAAMGTPVGAAAETAGAAIMAAVMETARAAAMEVATAADTAPAGRILLVLLPREIRENLQAANGSGGRLPVLRF